MNVENRVSDNVGGVKQYLRKLQRALGTERHLRSRGRFASSNPGSLVISQARNSACPMHLFGRNTDRDYYFELLLLEEERDARSISQRSIAHLGDFRAVPRANRT